MVFRVAIAEQAGTVRAGAIRAEVGPCSAGHRSAGLENINLTRVPCEADDRDATLHLKRGNQDGL